ncbi:MAG TPA: hypothetical protein PLK82_04480 [Bacteroidales bacterium]|nr:hypothetical protein [Bacteroidales bacterium]
MKIIDSPREGMQSLDRVIATADKVRYINHLMQAGLDTVETGSLASPKVIPQLADTLEVLRVLERGPGATNLMVLALNGRGAEVLASHERVTHISYPFSFSPVFLERNLKTTVEESLATVAGIVSLCSRNGKEPVIYISMAFGNPYGDPWSLELLAEWTGRLHRAGVRTLVLSNVSVEIGAGLIREAFTPLLPLFPDMEFGLHLHTSREGWTEKVEAAWETGVRRFDGVMNGRGGCPMAGGKMLGNLKTENLVEFARMKGISCGVDEAVLETAGREAGILFNYE